MVRKGSPVRVRQRAPQKPAANGGFVVQAPTRAGPHGRYGSVWKQLAAFDAAAVLCGLSPAALGAPPNAARINDLPPDARAAWSRAHLPGRPRSRSTASEGPGSHRARRPCRGCQPRASARDRRLLRRPRARRAPVGRLSRAPAPAAAIEDACQAAWERLSCRSDVDLRATGPRMIGDRGAARGVAALPSRARGNASRIPDGTLVVIPAGHESNLEQPEPLNDVVREFCRARSARPA
jgi:pimeloyl-ACP methyl ester carboxylesterase